MKKTTIIWAIFVLMYFPAQMQAQEVLELTEQEKKELTEHTGHMLEGFLINLSRIGSKDTPADVKESVIRQTLRLFDHDGESYYDDDNKFVPAPRMQVTSLRNKNGSKIPIKTYLENLKRISYRKVVIEQASTIYLSKLQKVGDHYMATATYWQYFRGERGDGVVYQDRTKKEIRIIVQVEEVLGERMFVVRFGDINAKETTV
jgi:hypothetical protein